jgi:uncharacterized protein YtpQ (UPF0354 family)
MILMSKPSRHEFLDDVALLVSARFPLVILEKSEPDFSLRINGHWFSLENLYRISQANHEQLPKHVERWVTELLRAAEGSPDRRATFEEIRDRILPMVHGGQHRDPVDQPMIRQQLLENLFVAYALDADRTISYISRKSFESWKIDIEELHQTALANLVTRSQVLQAQAAPDESGQVNLILIQTMDGYDASRILLPGLHDHLSEHLGSPFIGGIPNRDILVCCRNEPDNLARVNRQIKEDFRTMPHQVSDQLFLITRDGIAPYVAA